MKISKSKINTYKKCPREFKYIYVDKQYSEPNKFMKLGLDVHSVAENVGNILKDMDDAGVFTTDLAEIGTSNTAYYVYP